MAKMEQHPILTTKEMWNEVGRRAKEQGISRARFVRDAIRHYVAFLNGAVTENRTERETEVGGDDEE